MPRNKTLFISALVFYTTVAAFFLYSGKLYWDNIPYFNIYRNTLRLIAEDGFPYIWDPRINNGLLFGYYTILGAHGYGLVESLSILTGIFLNKCFQLNINLASLYAYIIYFFVIAPALLVCVLTGIVRCLIPQGWNSSLVGLVLIISPIYVFNLSDPNLLTRILYFAFFIYAVLSYDSIKSNLKFVCSVWVIVTGFGYYYVFLAIYFMPVFLALTPRLVHILRNLTSIQLCSLVLSVILLLALYFYANQLGSNIVNLRSSGNGYKISDFVPGSFIELISFSTPFIGFEWFPEYRGSWEVKNSLSERVAYGFIGCGSLLYTAYAIYKALAKKEIYIIVICITILYQYIFFVSGYYSPIIKFIVKYLPSIANFNHYNDIGFRGGTSILIELMFMHGLINFNKIPRRFSIAFLCIPILPLFLVTGLELKFVGIIVLIVCSVYVLNAIKANSLKVAIAAVLVSQFIYFSQYLVAYIFKGSAKVDNDSFSLSYIESQLFGSKFQLPIVPIDKNIIQLEAVEFYPGLIKGQLQENADKYVINNRYYSQLFVEPNDISIVNCENYICLLPRSNLGDTNFTIRYKDSFGNILFIVLFVNLTVFLVIVYDSLRLRRP